MNPCESCPLADKIYECCGRYPESGAAVDFILENNQRVSACPYLGHDGRCRIYDLRPPGCRRHSCHTSFRYLYIDSGWDIRGMFDGGDDHWPFSG